MCFMGFNFTDEEWIDALNLAETKSNDRLIEDLEILVDREKKFLEHSSLDAEAREIVVYNIATFASAIARVKMFKKLMDMTDT